MIELTKSEISALRDFGDLLQQWLETSFGYGDPKMFPRPIDRPFVTFNTAYGSFDVIVRPSRPKDEVPAVSTLSKITGRR